MSLLHSRLVTMAIAVLVCQIGSALAPPIAACGAELVSSLSVEEVRCDCDHGPAAICPMHKGTRTASSADHDDDGTTGWCRGHDTPDHEALIVTAQPCLIERRAECVRPDSGATTLAEPAAPAIELTRPPPLQPPRG